MREAVRDTGRTTFRKGAWMTKVVHLTSAHRRYDQRILWRECCSLREHGYDVTLIVNDDRGNETLRNGIRILSTGIMPQGRWQRMTEGVRRVYKLGTVQDADIYHLHDAELLTIALKLKKSGKKVIFDSHEVYGEVIKGREWIPSWTQGLLSNAYNWYETHVCKQIDGVIHIGKYDGKDWFAGRSKRFVYVGNYPRLNEYQGIQIPAYQTRRNICFSGGLSEEYNLLKILEAADKAGTGFVLAGRFSSEAFQRNLLEHDKHQIVQYAGFLNRRDIFGLYGKCAVGMCIYPDTGGQLAKIDNFNTKVYEYMVMEMPVILANWPYKNEMIKKYHFGLTADPEDVMDIAAKIKWLMNHPKEAEEMGKNGRRLVEEQFSWERNAEPELLKLYGEIA